MGYKLDLIAVAAFAGTIAGCGIVGPAHNEPPPPDVDATVTMNLADFSPETITIRRGDTVQWRNISLISHTVTADKSLAHDPANVERPEGAESFHSGTVKAGGVWSYTFKVAGTYRYVCLPHERKGMIGTVIVE